jgi:hypothetical protein
MSASLPYIPPEWSNMCRPTKVQKRYKDRDVQPCAPNKTAVCPTEIEMDYVSNVIKSDTTAVSTPMLSAKDCVHVGTTCESILKCITMTPVSVDEPILLLDNIIAKLPFKDVLHKLSMCNTTHPNLTLISKRFEESFMRVPMHQHERSCVMGDNCECNFIDPKKPFTAVEFCPPMGNPSSASMPPHMCVICHRKLVQTCFYEAQFQNNHRWDCVIQSYGNIYGEDGEYSRDVVLVSPPNTDLVRVMPLPIACHQRNQYTVDDSAVRHLIQNNMTHLPSSQGFVLPSSGLSSVCTPPY